MTSSVESESSTGDIIKTFSSVDDIISEVMKIHSPPTKSTKAGRKKNTVVSEGEEISTEVFKYYISASGVVYFKRFKQLAFKKNLKTELAASVHDDVEIAIKDSNLVAVSEYSKALFGEPIRKSIEEKLKYTSNPSQKADIVIDFLKKNVERVSYYE